VDDSIEVRYALRMKPWITPVIVLALTLPVLCSPEKSPHRRIPCKTPDNATSCCWTHGRFGLHNGNPAFRLWRIGTHRILGIYSGPSVDRINSPDNEDPELPASVRRKFTPFKTMGVFGDFEVCPLEPEREGVMQAACIESAKNIVAEK
jgi:hypothetical protein